MASPEETSYNLYNDLYTTRRETLQDYNNSVQIQSNNEGYQQLPQSMNRRNQDSGRWRSSMEMQSPEQATATRDSCNSRRSTSQNYNNGMQTSNNNEGYAQLPQSTNNKNNNKNIPATIQRFEEQPGNIRDSSVRTKSVEPQKLDQHPTAQALQKLGGFKLNDHRKYRERAVRVGYLMHDTLKSRAAQIAQCGLLRASHANSIHFDKDLARPGAPKVTRSWFHGAFIVFSPFWDLCLGSFTPFYTSGLAPSMFRSGLVLAGWKMFRRAAQKFTSRCNWNVENERTCGTWKPWGKARMTCNLNNS